MLISKLCNHFITLVDVNVFKSSFEDYLKFIVAISYHTNIQRASTILVSIFKPIIYVKGDSMNLTLIDNYVVESFFFQGPSCSVFEYFALNQPKRKGFNCSFDVKHVSVAQFLPKLQVKMSKTDITLVSNSSNHPLKPRNCVLNKCLLKGKSS